MPQVKLFASLRKAAGTKETSVTGTSVGEVLSRLVKQYPTLVEYLFSDDAGDPSGTGQIRPYIIITINGHPTTDFTVALTEHDQIAIFPPIGGGTTVIPL